jgi:uncharacterized protein YbbC (DUF1343 family)
MSGPRSKSFAGRPRRLGLLACWLAGCLLLAGPLAAEVIPGVEVFLQAYTHLVRDQRVALMTNQTGRDRRGTPTIDLLQRHPQVNLVGLYSVEHGIRGKAAAGEHVQDDRDAATGLPVISLYGKNGRKPSQAMLDSFDVMIYDFQDVGSRAYTYIWSLAEVMAACGPAGKTVIVLDRPSPLSINQIDGPVTEERWRSFIGLYPVPRVYGMTVGELARLLNAEYQLGCRLIVIPMSGYSRTLGWQDVGWAWTATSPNIPSPESAMCFAATGTMGVTNQFFIDIGGERPFQVVGASWLNAEKAASDLARFRLPGVQFIAQPQYLATAGSLKGKTVPSILLKVTEPSRFLPSTTELVMLWYLQRHAAGKLQWQPATFDAFDKAMGTIAVRESLMRGDDLQKILDGWRAGQRAFLAQRERYLIY